MTADGEQGMVVVMCALDEPSGVPVHTMRTDAGTALWLGATPPEAEPTFVWRASSELRVAHPGRWVLSLVQTAPARLLIDGEVAIDGYERELAGGRDFFGMGKEEQ